jgi:hypothetical protein
MPAARARVAAHAQRQSETVFLRCESARQRDIFSRRAPHKIVIDP